MSQPAIKIIFNDDIGDGLPVPGMDALAQVHAATEVDEALKGQGYLTELVAVKGAGFSGLDALIQAVKELAVPQGALVFNLCEAAFGKSALEMHVAALLELYGARFTGSGPLTLGLALNKGLTKDVLASRDILTPEYCVVDAPPSKLKRGLKFPLIVKPLHEDASLGIDSGAVVGTMKELKKRVEFVMSAFRQPAIVEEYVDGREFNIAILGNGKEAYALPPSEIEFVDFPLNAPKICCYEAKWIQESPLYKKTKPVCPAHVPDSLRDELQVVAIKAYHAMGCRDYARVDMRLGEDGNIKVLEVNPNPDISTDAGFARAGGAAGFDYPRLVSEIVNVAALRYASERMKEAAPLAV
ncbi:MAG: D-alanine--D-alanine ligase [Deltaproteobacteria bacterium]|nr:D-alanine--D-alanine ligase [Deltaproteobacteria bacterium]